MTRIAIKPLSVNVAWQGKRFKTKEYLNYEKNLLSLLPHQKLPDKPFKIYIEFGMANSASDWDNPIKPFVDVLQKKYLFDDKDIQEGTVKKIKVKKGEEYINFKIEKA
jgi:Holliday junction resolvase RusA-like endonuclease